MNLGHLTASQFLHEYWQKQHLLIRQAFENFTPPLDADELAGLACDSDVESRLVIQQPNGSPEWIVRHGPFTTADFARLPKTHWTLLVQDVDKHLPECADLLDHFRFLPEWRIDDIMISYAAPSGSVGPHIDAYDVFLLQGLGRRRWELDPEPDSTSIIPDIDLKLLDKFQPSIDHTLRRGDILYLPPGVAHHGIAQNDCMTLSIGCRAPSHAEMMADLAAWIAGRMDPERRYADPGLTVGEAGDGAVSTRARQAIRDTVRHYLHLDDADIDRWFGCFITEPKPWLMAAPPETPLPAERLAARLRANRILVRAPATRIHFIRTRDQTTLFCDGEAFDLHGAAARLAPILSRRRRLSAADLGDAINEHAVTMVLAEFYNRGKYHFEDE